MMNGDKNPSKAPGKDGMDAALRAALERLRLGVPEHPKNRDLMTRAARLNGRRFLNVRMLCRESGLSPTTVYRRFPWAVALLQEEDGATVPASSGPPSAGEVIARQAREITALNRVLGVLRAELHQVTQANIALGERLEGAEQARQAAVDAGRRRKETSAENVSRLQR